MTSYFSHLLWRRDVLARAGLQPPNTWQELIEVAKALNGTDMDGGEKQSTPWRRAATHSASPGSAHLPALTPAFMTIPSLADGEGDFATCINLNPLLQSGSTLSQVLASMTQSQVRRLGGLACALPLSQARALPCRPGQSELIRADTLHRMRRAQGTSTGWLFDPNNMQSFVDTPVRNPWWGAAGRDAHATQHSRLHGSRVRTSTGIDRQLCPGRCTACVHTSTRAFHAHGMTAHTLLSPTAQAFTHALDLLRQLAPYNLETVSYEESAIATSNPFVLRKCALHAALMVVFKVRRGVRRSPGLLCSGAAAGGGSRREC